MAEIRNVVELRAAWEHGIQTAKAYGDNVHHLYGVQADRHFALFLWELGVGEKPAAVARSVASQGEPTTRDDVF